MAQPSEVRPGQSFEGLSVRDLMLQALEVNRKIASLRDTPNIKGSDLGPLEEEKASILAQLLLRDGPFKVLLYTFPGEELHQFSRNILTVQVIDQQNQSHLLGAPLHGIFSASDNAFNPTKLREMSSTFRLVKLQDTADNYLTRSAYEIKTVNWYLRNAQEDDKKSELMRLRLAILERFLRMRLKLKEGGVKLEGDITISRRPAIEDHELKIIFLNYTPPRGKTFSFPLWSPNFPSLTPSEVREIQGLIDAGGGYDCDQTS